MGRAAPLLRAHSARRASARSSLVAGCSCVGAFAVAVVGSARARRRAAGDRARLLPGRPRRTVGWTIRAQVFALPALPGSCGSSLPRRGGRRAGRSSRIPILVVWANLHGTAALGAMLTVLLGRDRARRTRADGVRQVTRCSSRLAPLRCSPRRTALDTAGYYRAHAARPPLRATGSPSGSPASPASTRSSSTSSRRSRGALVARAPRAARFDLVLLA